MKTFLKIGYKQLTDHFFIQRYDIQSQSSLSRQFLLHEFQQLVVKIFLNFQEMTKLYSV